MEFHPITCFVRTRVVFDPLPPFVLANLKRHFYRLEIESLRFSLVHRRETNIESNPSLNIRVFHSYSSSCSYMAFHFEFDNSVTDSNPWNWKKQNLYIFIFNLQFSDDFLYQLILSPRKRRNIKY